MKILVIKFRNIGDVLLVTPLLHNLKRFYPQAKIDVAINSDAKDILIENPHIDNLIIYERNNINNLPKAKRIFWELIFFLDFVRKSYDLVINLTEGDRGGLISKLTLSKIKIGYLSKNKLLKNVYTNFLPKQDFRHTVETNLDPLRLLNIPIKNKKVEVFCTPEDHEFIDLHISNIGRYVHIHPVSRWLFKCIADKTMAKIIDFCQLKLGFKVVITAAPIEAEIKKVNSIISMCQSNPLNLSGQLSLKQTIALNQKASCFIGVDTAIMHMSAANDTPVLAFFGPSGADHWGPWDNQILESGYTKRNGIQHMGKHTVISESRDCQPCGKDGCGGSKVSDCLMGMNFKEIKKAVIKLTQLENLN